MITTTTNFIHNKDFTEVCVVKGSCCACIQRYFSDTAKAINDAKDEAFNRMIIQADKIHADAIIDVKYITEHVGEDVIIFISYGTAVKFIERKKDEEVKITSL